MTFLRSKTNRHRMLALLALAAGTLCACTPAPAPSPTPTVAFASEEEAFAAAEEVYRAYLDAFNRVDLQDPNTFDPLADFTTGEYLSSERESLSEMHASGQQRSGSIQIVWFEGTEYPDSDHVRAITCNDVSETTFTDGDGVNLVPADRPDFYALLLTFAWIDSSLLLESAVPSPETICPAQ